MTEEIALEKFKNPDKLNSPEETNFVIGYLSGWISDCEELLNEQNFQVSVKFGQLYEAEKKIALAERRLELEPIYLEREKTKMKLKQLLRYRSDLRSRYDVLVNKHFNKHY